jgi:subtilisin family serine protease
VAGIVALMLSANPELSPAQVKAILRATASDIDAPVRRQDRRWAGRRGAVVHESLATPGQLAPTTCRPWERPAAKAGNKEPASIVVATNGPEGPVTGLALGDFRAKAGPVAPGLRGGDHAVVPVSRDATCST